jgi:hypothetical protein
VKPRNPPREGQPFAAGGFGHVQELYDDHSDIDYRMDVSLPFLSRALKT